LLIDVNQHKDIFEVHYKTLRVQGGFSRPSSDRTATHEIGKFIDDLVKKKFDPRVNTKIAGKLRKLKRDLSGSGGGLNIFKRLFNDLELYPNPNNTKAAWIPHLWGVGLHATRKNWDHGLKKILSIKQPQ
jgi:hypothetical protein